ncbi:hemerythrin domain-containing protein [Azospirillum halopraeferens]|uniref:hemerythrin domain-containing protein n=1 Tax=Azospirillum halopraeferens TaxID=34010 RepID=UPI0003FEB833|nr:hemerythrin domain-containing protein [Azospirillum halopraeferens]
MTDAIAVIKTEHRNLMRVVNLFDIVMRAAAPGDGEGEGERRAPDFALLDAIVEYLQTFTDRYHHPKEDRFLFRALRARDPDAGPILDELEREHEGCYGATAGLKEALEAYRAGRPGAAERFAAAAATYRDLQLRHVQKEEGIVIPMATRALTPEDWRVIDAAFADNRDPLFSDDAQESARALYSRIVHLAPAPHGLGEPR